jgi:hypothetical protein
VTRLVVLELGRPQTFVILSEAKNLSAEEKTMRTSRMHYVAAIAGLVLLVSLAGSSKPPAPAPPAAPLDPSKMPDIYGLHIGMTAQEAKAVLDRQFAQFRAAVQPLPIPFGPGNRQRGIFAFRVNAGGAGGQMAADVTLPPNPQLVWHIARVAAQPNVNRAVLLAAIRQKYGKETYAIAWGGKAGETTTDDSRIRSLVWLMDEQGQPLTGVRITFVADRPFNCGMGQGVLGTRPPDYQPNPDNCAKSFVGLSVQFPPGEIINTTTTEMVDYPLAQRSAQATDAYTRNGNQQMQQQMQKKAQEAKPEI